MIINSNSVEETQNLAQALARVITPGTTILLNGDLGAGKTTFTQGFARELGIKRPVKSPTFTLVREYQTPAFMLYHLDVYRLGEEGGAEDLGLSEYFNPDSVALVEWSEFITDDLPDDVLVIDLSRIAGDATEQQRQIELSATGPHSQHVLDQLGIDDGTRN
ncbi:tRNA threonylcarbamoyladenosine biosynthesis protein TsaE [Weissella uvarum]|uniref:tRNA (adenosine(37)-N6)-threonylcarbamoyltransferase complex ATPase subunit type 1 TsaE n=1 Tax=Weissella uvarum TaxID=1479233 RepID=UPI0019607B4A|nr:tRNA (adenosine(37)-N6)-threonylcarbamoyltransferase complex ATPase subunit type 1 TsaE [Weissella uvarum]MBM7618007.1 tRNA threonylcarbamoyladenosine biosynthesis protein TsaE [Weissella uvarum]MCM0596226.1 tRNA (adenosine(37)-N6)-threonylcarbamoyltransferase complex ATPase subunit type 1 TsaE [Weissella uvarum]